ncbi:MAG: PKD domain-containing protein [Anaerolineales bacterium]|nr:MAG: PKD domain-containing protein [Anaerolineales bacterium]
MRQEWLMVLLVVVLLVPVGCGPATAQEVPSEGGLSDSATHNVQVNELVSDNQPPTAVISGPTSGLVGQTLTFSGVGSSDDGDIVRYAWDFGDGNTDSGKEVTHSYSAAGSYKVTLTVTDDGNGTDQVVAQIETSTGKSRTYTVKSGDTLMEISRKLFNDDAQYWDEIADLNSLKAPYTIHPGQELIVPVK